tara:strand:+ start:13011 stop:14504 length:1494 start_codon:yes stop_codon:yes gene_type:complete
MKSITDINDIEYVKARKGQFRSSTPCPIGEAGKINPHASQFDYGSHKVTVFHIKPVYYEHASSSDENLVFRPMYEVCEHYGNHTVVFKYEKLKDVHPRFIEWLQKRMNLINGRILVTSPLSGNPVVFGSALQYAHSSLVRPRIGLTVTTVYPDPNPETTTTDGRVDHTGDSNWDNTHDAASGTSTVNDIASVALQVNTGYLIQRHFYLFDTSAVGSDSIDSAVLSTYIEAVNVDNGALMGITEATPASNTEIVAGDYDQVGSLTSPVELASQIDFGSMSASSYSDFTLNASGEAHIDKSGVTGFSGRLSDDIDDSASTNKEKITISFSETSGTTQDPKLAVTHSASGTTVSASVESSASSVPTPTVAGGAVVSPSSQSSTSSTPAPSVAGGAVVSAGESSGISSNPSPSVIAGGTVIGASVESSASSVPAPTVLVATIVSVGVNTGASSVPSPSYAYGQVLTPDAVVAVASVPDPTVEADFWQDTYDSDDNIWSDTY